jgi:hypothetical protein
MIRTLFKVFGCRKVKELEKQVEELRVKLDQKQQHIDKTNRYWKKKMHHLKISEAL